MHKAKYEPLARRPVDSSFEALCYSPLNTTLTYTAICFVRIINFISNCKLFAACCFSTHHIQLQCMTETWRSELAAWNFWHICRSPCCPVQSKSKGSTRSLCSAIKLIIFSLNSLLHNYRKRLYCLSSRLVTPMLSFLKEQPLISIYGNFSENFRNQRQCSLSPLCKS